MSVIGRVLKRKSRRIGLVAASTAAAVGLTIAGLGVASAQVTNGLVDVNFRLDAADSTNRIAYSSLLAQIRQAVSVPSSDGSAGGQTQDSTGIVRVNLTASDDSGFDRTVSLYINAQNLYLLGFQPQHQQFIYAFRDAATFTLPQATTRVPMTYGGSYTSLSSPNAANRGLESVPISYFDVRGSITQLAQVTTAIGANSQATARSLMMMIQFISEAARFNDVEGIFRTAMGGYTQIPGLPGLQHALELDWAALSTFFFNWQNGNHPAPRTLQTGTGTITFNNATDVRRRVPILLGSRANVLGTGPDVSEL